MERNSDWIASNSIGPTRREETLKTIPTDRVWFPASAIKYAGTTTIETTIKSTEDVVHEMRMWLKTGVAPDGTRMLTDEASQWWYDFYQATVKADVSHECLPEESTVDYYYWSAPFLAHIGNINLVMMHSKVNMQDGTHLPTDRLRQRTKGMKNLGRLAEKRMQVQLRQRLEFVREAMEGHGQFAIEAGHDGEFPNLADEQVGQGPIDAVPADSVLPEPQECQ